MGMPALPVRRMVEYVRQVRGLLAGEDVLYKEGKYERWIRLLSTDRKLGCINVDDEIPIHIAPNGPKALAAVGEVGDGWVSVAQPPDGVRAGIGVVKSAARDAGRRFDGPNGRPHTTLLSTGCILRDGETFGSKRVIDRVGPVVVVAAHAAWETAHGGAGIGIADERTAHAYGAYIDRYAARRASPADRRYLDVHEGHMMFLKDGEEAFVAEPLIPILSFTGRGEEVAQRIRELGEAGVDNLALQVIPGMARDLIEEFGRHVIAKL
jgi:alkanesulfonate monooxygenase SsuD/methylene tetrahydromethanopterin reductase-like flavin-dependent oxidoreductase (luciferase family)